METKYKNYATASSKGKEYSNGKLEASFNENNIRALIQIATCLKNHFPELSRNLKKYFGPDILEKIDKKK